MATLDSLKAILKQQSNRYPLLATRPLSDTEYSAGFDILMRASEQTIYQDFIVPELCQLLGPLVHSRGHISVLEIGPGPKSILAHVPSHLRLSIRRYCAFEPNELFASNLTSWLFSTSGVERPLPCLERPPDIHQTRFGLDSTDNGTDTTKDDEKFDVILFCHSLYGMKPKQKFIERSLEMLVKQPDDGMVVVFHRDESLNLGGLVPRKRAALPAGYVRTADNDEVLDCFAAFIAGFSVQDAMMGEETRAKWRNTCRAMGSLEETDPTSLVFSSPQVMLVFNQHATSLPDLSAQVPLVEGNKAVKNREARLHRPAAILKPTTVQHVQQCVQWALQHDLCLTVVGGGHSGHCLVSHVLAIDMCAFNQVDILMDEPEVGDCALNPNSLVVAGAGCTTGDIIRKTMASGLTVPLGARPSVGAGLWLQGGIGHLSRQHGLACDAIIGATLVSVASGQIIYAGIVPNQHMPVDAVKAENAEDLLWAIRGAGTNFGIVTSVTFKASRAPTYSIRNWVIPLSDSSEACHKVAEFDAYVAQRLPRTSSIDAFLYWSNGWLYLGVTLFEHGAALCDVDLPGFPAINAVLGPHKETKTMDSVGLFEAEMYIAGMHGGHGNGKTSSFKRCLFFKDIGTTNISHALVAALRARPTPLCYLHLLQGGEAIADVPGHATAFGCRRWDFACVITGVWPREEDASQVARAAVHWVYNVAKDLLPLSCGAYGADLGPDPRDAELAAKAFGPNRALLSRLKRRWDPCNVLAYACPIPSLPLGQKLILLVTGKSCAGKDYCADVWASMLNTSARGRIKTSVASISDVTKREYAVASGADLDRLLLDRAYKEQHRPALTAFFHEQVRRQPWLPEEHFLDLVHGASDVEALILTGMRDEAPVAALSHLVPGSRLLEVFIEAKEATRCVRRQSGDGDKDKGTLPSTALSYSPGFVLDNNEYGQKMAETFAERRLLPLFGEDLQRLAAMVRLVPDFPRPASSSDTFLAFANSLVDWPYLRL